MKFAKLADAVTAAELDCAWLYRALEPLTAFGRRAFETIEPFAPGMEEQAAARARYVYELSCSLSAQRIAAMRDALRACPDPAPALARASMGEALDDAHFLELLRFLDALKIVAPGKIAKQTGALAHSIERGRAGKFGFYLSDAFSQELARAREGAERAQAQFDSAQGRLAQRVGAQLGRQDLGAGEFIVVRDREQPLPKEVRIVREAPGYFLCELELDEPALSALQARDAALAQSASAEAHVRATLSEAVRSALTQLQALLEEAAQLDIDLALAHFAQTYGCVPATVAQGSQVSFQRGAFLPMKLHLQAQGRAYEPISIDLREPAVITGPNMGGKSAALRTCGFLALLVAFGVPVPAAGAHIALVDQIAWLGAGTNEDRAGLLSSFASEVVRLKDVLARPSLRMLLLIDEFARTTTPHEGAALLTALLRALARSKRLAFAATHLANVAGHAQAPHYAVRGLRALPALPEGAGLHAALDALALAMDYSVVRVEGDAAPGSDAIALAQLLGLDEAIVAEAKEAVWTR